MKLMTVFDKACGENPFPVKCARFERSGEIVTAWKETIRAAETTVERGAHIESSRF